MNASILITVDVDDDYANSSTKFMPLSWQSVELCKVISDSINSLACFATFFVRADQQIYNTFGDYAYMFYNHNSLWKYILSWGNEVAFHSHLIGKNSFARYVMQPVHEGLENIDRSLDAVFKSGFHITSSRLSGFPMNDELFTLINSYNITHDSSCFPGFQSQMQNCSTWPYRLTQPFKLNTLLGTQQQNLDIIEIPLLIDDIKAPYDDKPKPRYINLTYHTKYFMKAIHNCHRQLSNNWPKSTHYYNLIMHPDEVNSHVHPGKHELYSFSLKTVIANISQLLKFLESSYTSVKSETICKVIA